MTGSAARPGVDTAEPSTSDRLLRLPGLRTFRSARFRLFVAAVLCALAVLAYAHNLVSSIPGWGTGAAFHDIMEAGRRFWLGLPTYTPVAVAPPEVVRTNPASILYPPTHFLVLWPLIAMPRGLQVLVWVALYQVALLVILVAVYASLGRPSRAELLVVAAMLLISYPVRVGVENGEVELLVAGLLVAVMAAFIRGRQVAAGGLLALAILVKPTLGVLLVLFFVWKRAFRLVAATAAAGAAVVLATLAMGWLPRWQAYAALIGPVGRGTALTINQSVNGLVLRLLLPEASGQPIAPLPLGTEITVDVLRLAVLAGLAYFLVRNRLDGAERQWSDYVLAVLALPLVQPYALAEHWTPALVAIPVIARLVVGRRMPGWALVGMVLAWVAMMVSDPVLFYISHHVPGPRLHQDFTALLFSSSLLYAVLLGFVSLGLGVRSRR